jgi:hypothetical protein
MKIRLLGVELLYADSRMDDGHDEANSSFWKFWERAQQIGSYNRSTLFSARFGLDTM